MAKTLRTPSQAASGLFKKTSTAKLRARTDVGCTLHELCNEDKGKVAKLLRQIVELERELNSCRAQTTKVRDDLQKNQHVRQRSADIMRENNTLKAKLIHAFALLRAYQHKIRIMDAAGTAAPALLPAASRGLGGASSSPQQTICHRCGQSPLIQDPVGSVNGLKEHVDHAQPPGKSQTMLADGIEAVSHNAAPLARQNQSASAARGFPSCAQQPGHSQDPSVTGAGLAVDGPSARQEPVAELATDMLAWQQDDTVTDTAEQMACKVLHFDPTLGTDGAFYFVSPDIAQQLRVSADEQLGPRATTSSLHQSQLQPAASSTQHGVQQSGQQGRGPGNVRVMLDTNCQAQSGAGAADQANTGNAEAQPAQVASGSMEQQAAGQAQPLFPVQGGGKAGVLLRAAAAAAAGCSHELVLAAAGQISEEDMRYAEPRASRTALTAEVPLTDCDISAVDMSAVDASATAHQQETGHAATAVTDVAKDESQLPAETNDTLQNHEPCLDPGSDRGAEDLHSLGFDSSLMDLVAEVEQMVACKQSNADPGSRRASPLLGSCTSLPDRPASTQRLTGCNLNALRRYQTVQYEEDFEENDVISLISDQEFAVR